MAKQNLHEAAGRFWQQRVGKYLSVIDLALTLLQKAKNLPKREPDLNRELFFRLLEAKRNLYHEDEWIIDPESKVLPDPDDQQRSESENKEPDFQFISHDCYESDPRRSQKKFTLECKRLGEKTASGWFNKNYSHEGIERFRHPKWKYGKDCASGAMAGYLQNMDGRDVLREVNKGCEAISLPKLVLVGKWCPAKPTRFKQILKRDFKFSPFTLHHFWVDIRQ